MSYDGEVVSRITGVSQISTENNFQESGGPLRPALSTSRRERVQIVGLEAKVRYASMLDKQVLTVAEVAAFTGLSCSTVTRMFARERGVLVLERPECMHKRRYRSIRIPRTVYERVIARISVK